MNLIVIMLDSLRQDHVSLYNQATGAPFKDVAACRTPNIDRFGRDCVIFENVYPEALPTIPVRTALMTGQRTLISRPWQPLADSDVTVAQMLGAEGYVSGLVSDTYHYRAPGMNFHRGFNSYHWIRGQEYDPFDSSPSERDVRSYVNEGFPLLWRQRVGQFLSNTDGFDNADKWFAPQVMRTACEWLRKNRKYEKSFLWVDSFDPHEPWDPPKPFDTYTDPNYKGPRLILPMGGRASDWASEAETRHIRGLYAGEVASVDHALGELFQTLEELGYYDDSAILLVADHGHPLADHGKFLKGTDRMFSELLKVPFFLRLPGGRNAGRRTKALAGFHDVLPTLFDLAGLGNLTHDMHGSSLADVVEGDADEARESVITGYHQGADRCVRDGKWSLIARPEGQRDELYDLEHDWRETTNLIDRCPDEAERLRRGFGSIYYRAGRPRAQPAAMDFKGVQGAYETASGVVD